MGDAQRNVCGAEGGVVNPVKAYLSAIGRKGGQKSRRKLTKAQARAMVKAREALRKRPDSHGLKPCA